LSSPSSSRIEGRDSDGVHVTSRKLVIPKQSLGIRHAQSPPVAETVVVAPIEIPEEKPPVVIEGGSPIRALEIHVDEVTSTPVKTIKAMVTPKSLELAPTTAISSPVVPSTAEADGVFGNLVSKDLDPRKAELLRQAQARVLAKRQKQKESPSGSIIDMGTPPTVVKPASGESDASPAASSNQNLPDQIEERLQRLREERRRSMEAGGAP